MGYDYSRQFLQTHRADVIKLTEVARKHTVLTQSSPDVQELMKVRRHINNILASMAVNDPDLNWVRTSIRTWIEANDPAPGIWTLYAGKSHHTLRGNNKTKMPDVFERSAKGTDETVIVTVYDITVKKNISPANLFDIFETVIEADKNNKNRIMFNSLMFPKWEENDHLMTMLKALKETYGFMVGRHDEQSGTLIRMELVRTPPTTKDNTNAIV